MTDAVFRLKHKKSDTPALSGAIPPRFPFNTAPMQPNAPPVPQTAASAQPRSATVER
jgi:hypothetical protein